MSTARAPESRSSSAGAIDAMWRSDPAPIQSTSWAKNDRSIRLCVTARRGNGATAPGSKPVAWTTSSGPGDPHEPGRDRRADLGLVGAPVAGNEREHEGAVAHEDERLDDLGEIAAHRAGRIARRRCAVRELLDPSLDRSSAQEGRDALDGVGPGHGPR